MGEMDEPQDNKAREENVKEKIIDQNEIVKRFKIKPDDNIFPFCIVWTPMPIISWFLPMIGHVGICTSEGIIHDYAGDKSISIDLL